jgi:hypothetical protein
MRVAWIVVVAGCGFHANPGTQEEAAALPDAAVQPDATTCPSSYGLTLSGSQSRYRLIPDGRPAWVQFDACAADLPGATHLVVLDTKPELDAAIALVAAPTTLLAGNAIWVGAVQQTSATLPADGWLWLDDSSVTGWGDGEPNDHDKQEDRDEQFVRIEKTKLYLQDSSGGTNNSALCECDGKPIAPAAAAALAADRPAS